MRVRCEYAAVARRVPLAVIVREWARIGVVGFGGPPAHVALLRRLVVDDRRWIDAREFEDANAACGLLPGPASTQLAIYCAQRLGGAAGALAGGTAFILPGLIAIIALAALALSDDPPAWVAGVGAGAGAAVIAVVVDAGIALTRGSLEGRGGGALARALAYLAAGAISAALAGVLVVVVLLACGLLELAWRRREVLSVHAWPIVLALATTELPELAWTALKVGALSYGGGFVIIPLMQGDAVDAYGWMTDAQFLNAVALGQITPGPVVQTVAVVGYAAAGLGGGLLAAFVAFAPSFVMVIAGGPRLQRLRDDDRAQAFLTGAGAAAIGAIAGSTVPLAWSLHEPWQFVLLGLAVLWLLVLRRGVVSALVAAGVVGALVPLF
jgi:chromate transporter